MNAPAAASFVLAVLVALPSWSGPVPAAATGAPVSGVVLPAQVGRPDRHYDETTLLVRFRPGAAADERRAARAQVAGTRVRGYRLVDGLEQVRPGRGLSVEQAILILRRLPVVEYAQRNHVVYLSANPNDAYFAEQWALHNTGQASSFGVWPAGVPDADIDWPEAWNAAAGQGAVVAVIDTGIDYRHSDLAANVWTNAAELNGVPNHDDDGNGYVDDVRGWDFANGDNDPLDGHGHGTHVAGTIAAIPNNGGGVAGVMWGGQVMALKMIGDDGTGLLSDAIAAIEYALDKGVRISNNSWGYTSYAPEEEADHHALRDAIQAAAGAGHLFVAAAGNELTDTDVTPHYPSSFDLDNIVSVAATDNTDSLAWFSSYGATTVDLGAPGDYVFSTYKLWNGVLDDYGWLSGTSMATPHVAGVAGLLLGLQPEWTYGQVRDRILGTARPLGALSGITATGGVLNIHAALSDVPTDPGGGGGGGASPPGVPTDFLGEDQGDGSVRLSWSDVDGETRYALERQSQHKRHGWRTDATLETAADITELLDAPGAGEFRYLLQACNDAGCSGYAVIEVLVTSPDGGGGGKPCRGRKCSN